MWKRMSWISLVTLMLSLSVFAKERNLLTNFAKDNIQDLLVEGTSWLNFPVYNDRETWDKLAGGHKEEYISAGEKYLDFDWPAIAATSYLEFVRSGDRYIMQRPLSERTTALRSLFFAEMMEGKGRFLDQIVNGVWSFCELSYWGLSAHLSLQKAGPGLPDVNEPTIDLGAGRLAADLAWIYYFLHDEFDNINPLISIRLKQEITNKILTPYYEREDFWWMSFNTDDHINNWNPWCNYNSLICILLIEEDQAKKINGIKKVMRSVDRFINYYHDDGGCEEGPSYWSHAGGKLFEVLELLYKVSDGKIDIYGDPLIANMGRYIYRAYIADPYFINFADASARIHTLPGIIYRYGKRISDPNMTGFGAFLADSYNMQDQVMIGKIESSLENLMNVEEILNAEAKEPLISEFWLPGTEIMGARDKEGTTDGFYFAAKGGYNKESHNHNDVGTFILYYNGEPCLIDAGVGTYTRKTFGPERYNIWTMQSGYHNLPKINGIDQKDGHEYAAKNCQFKSNRKNVSFSVDISQAYPEEAKVKSWIRSYQLNRGKNFTISDNYELTNVKDKTSLNFMTSCQVDIQDPGKILLKGNGFTLMMEYNASRLQPAVESIDLSDEKLVNAWPEGLSRIVFKFKDSSLKCKTDITIKKM